MTDFGGPSADDVLFDEPGDGQPSVVVDFDAPVVESSGADSGSAGRSQLNAVRIDPVKARALDAADDDAHRTGRLRAALLAVGCLAGVVAACFVDRRRRTARERLVGVPASAVTGSWGLVVGLSLLPGAVVGSVLGAITVAVLRAKAVHPESGLRAAVSPLRAFSDSLSLSVVVGVLAATGLAMLMQRIPLVEAVRGAPLMQARRWRLVGALVCAVGAVCGVSSRLDGVLGQAGIGLCAVGAAMLAWALWRARLPVALIALAAAACSLFALDAERASETGAVVDCAVSAFVVVLASLVAAYAVAAPGQHAVRLGVPKTERGPLGVLRSTAATRPGPWPLSALIGATLAFSAAGLASRQVEAAALPPAAAGQRDALVFRDSAPGATLSALAAADPQRFGELAAFTVDTAAASLRPADAGSPARPRRYPVTVAAFEPARSPGEIRAAAVIGERAAGALQAGGEPSAVIVREAWQGAVPAVGDTVTLTSGAGSRPLRVVAVVERAPGGAALWVSPQAFASVQSDHATHLMWSDAEDAAHVELAERAVMGRASELVGVFRAAGGPNESEKLGHRALDLVQLFELAAVAVLVRRWALERHGALARARSAAVGPSSLARSVTQDAVAHVAAAGLAGSAAGLLLGRALVRAGTPVALDGRQFAASVLAPALVAAVVARVPLADGRSSPRALRRRGSGGAVA